MDRSLRKLMKVMPPLKGQRHTKVNWERLEEGVGLTYPQSFKDVVSVYGSSHWFDKFSRSPTLGGKVVSWRAGARLFREMWPLIQAHVPEDNFRAEFVRDLLRL